MNDNQTHTPENSIGTARQGFLLSSDEIKSLLIVLCIGFLARLLLLPLPGFRADMEWYVSLATVLSKYGLLDAYSHQQEVSGQLLNYPPFAIEVLWIFSPLVNWSTSTSIKWLPCAIHRILPIMADLILAFLFYWSVRDPRTNQVSRLQSKSTHWLGFWTVVLFLFNPGVLYAGAGYGQIDSVGVLGLVSSLVALHLGFPFLTGILGGLAFGFKIQVLIFLPALFGIVLYRNGFKACLKCLVGFSIALLLPWLPFLLTGRGQTVWDCTFGTNLSWRIDLTTGAFNLWSLTCNPLLPDRLPLEWLFNSDGTIEASSIVAMFTYRKVGIILFALGYAFSFGLAFRNRSSIWSDWWFLAAVGYLFFTVTTRIHERYLLYSLVCATPMIMAWPCWGRTISFFVLSVAYILNLLVIAPISGNSPELSAIPLWLHRLGGGMVLLSGCWLLLPPSVNSFEALMTSSRAVLLWIVLIITFGLLFYAISNWRTSSWRNHLYLQDMPFSEPFSQSWDIPQRGVSVQLRNPLTVHDVIWARGMGSHARSRLVFNVAGPAMLHGAVGIDDQTMEYARGELIASIRINDATVFESDIIRSGNPAVPFSVSLPNTQNKLELIADPLEVELDDHVDWLGMSIQAQ